MPVSPCEGLQGIWAWLCGIQGPALGVQTTTSKVLSLSPLFKNWGKKSHNIKLTTDHPKGYNSMFFSAFIKLCNHHLQFQNIPSLQKKAPSPSAVTPPPPQPLTIRNHSVYGSVCSGRFPSVESHPVCPSVSTSFTEHHVLRVHPCDRKVPSPLFMAKRCSWVWRDHICISIICWWSSGLFPLWLLWIMLLWTRK